MTPSKISQKFPWDSVFQNSESETVAQNIAKIQARTGDQFRVLSKDEYREECEKDGNMGKVLYGDWKCPFGYDDIAAYMQSPHSAAKVCKDWRAALLGEQAKPA